MKRAWRRNLRLLLAVAVVSGGSLTRAWAWGEEGHKLVADIAAAGLGPHARQRVRALLDGRTMAQVSLWPDDMRRWQTRPDAGPPPSLAEDPVAIDFYADPKNSGQPTWHYVNLPVGSVEYRRNGVGARPDDVIQIIRRCVEVLKGQPRAGENLNAPQALRLLIHFVGDMHQPLHVGCGYWRPGAGGRILLAAPGEAAFGLNDLGGNAVSLAQGGNLHSYWDERMVTSARGSRSRAQYLRNLISLAGGGQSAPWRLSGDARAWAAGWAADSVRAASAAYRPLDFRPLRIVQSQGRKRVQGTVSLPARYAANFKTTVDTQLARGGFRLAALLNDIWP